MSSSPKPDGAAGAGIDRPVHGAGNFDALPCAWLQLDATGRIGAVNAALLALVGHAPDALIGRPFDMLMPAASRVMFQSVVQPLLKLHGQVSELSLSVRPAAGPVVDVLFYAARCGDGLGACVQVLLAPIRQRRRIEAEMVRVKRAADQAPGMVFELQVPAAAEPWRLPYASDAIRTLFGVTADAAARDAEVVLRCILPTDRTRWAAEMRDAAAAGAAWQSRCRVLAPDGRERLYEWHAIPRRAADGSALWNGHVADVTAGEQLQKALRERSAMERLAQGRSEFIARVSHELRTPLNGILGFTELLRGDDKLAWSPQQRAWLAVVEDSGRHLLGIVNQLLEVSRVEAGDFALLLQPVAVGPLVEQALAVVAPQAQAGGIELRREGAQAPLLVQAEAQRLRQVLVNLIGNAVKYNRPGGHATVAWSQAGGQVSIDVSDTGPGLTAAQCERLFEPFNRLGAERTATEGAGLGLFISHHLVQLMGGTLEAHSTPGEGSRFCVVLPGSAAALAPAEAQGAAPAVPATRGHVLYVEDNPVNSLLMQAMLQQRPAVDLVLAGDGAQALQAVRRRRPDLILLDLNLPDGDGGDLLLRLRASADLAGVPCIAVSAACDDHTVALARECGFDDFWSKPLRLQHTLAEVDRWLQGAAAGPPAISPRA